LPWWLQPVCADDERYGESWSHQPAQKWTPRKREPTGEADVVILENGVRFEGLILEEDEKKVRLARYSGSTVAPHTLGLYKSDIARIIRIGPALRSSLEPEVRELLHGAQVAWQLERTRAAWQQAAETVEEAQREAVAAAERQRLVQQASLNAAAYRGTPGTAYNRNNNSGQYRLARAPVITSPPTVTRGFIPRPAPAVRRVAGG
jgi:hypothetical protein